MEVLHIMGDFLNHVIMLFIILAKLPNVLNKCTTMYRLLQTTQIISDCFINRKKNNDRKIKCNARLPSLYIEYKTVEE